MKLRAKTGMRISVMALSVLFIAVTLISCGGGGGGGGGGVLPSTTPAGTFTKTVNHTGAASYYTQFFNTTYTEIRYMMLYLAQDIKGSGNIKSISFKNSLGTVAAVTCPNMTVKIGHTSVSTLGTTYANNVEQGRGTFTTVLNNASVTVPAGAAGDYFTVNLGTQFNYNGVDNLVVEVTRTAVCNGDVGVNEHAASPAYNAVLADVTSSTALTGSAFSTVVDMRFAFKGGDDRVEYPNGIGNAIPFWTLASGRHAQMLHLASDLNGSGPITGIAMISSEAPTDAASYTVTVKLGHTSLAALTDTFANNFDVGSPVTVAAAATFTVPAGVPAGTPIWLPLTGTFKYNGTDNLIVDIEVTNDPTNNTFWVNDDTIAGRRMYAAVGSATGTVDFGAYHTVFRFNGGTMDVITDGVNGYIIPVASPTSDYIAQILYDSAALGTGGRITSLSFRLSSDSNAFDHTDVNLVLGHTTLSALGGASLAANIESNRTAAFSGTISIPAGLKAGDWVKVPLTMPFTYDPTKNLVVQWDAPVFATLNWARGSSDSAQYAGHVQGNIGDRTSDVSNAAGNFVLDMSLTVKK